jgi:hypothetical protein
MSKKLTVEDNFEHHLTASLISNEILNESFKTTPTLTAQLLQQQTNFCKICLNNHMIICMDTGEASSIQAEDATAKAPVSVPLPLYEIKYCKCKFCVPVRERENTRI